MVKCRRGMARVTETAHRRACEGRCSLCKLLNLYHWRYHSRARCSEQTKAHAVSAWHQRINCPVMEKHDMATAKKAAAKAPAKKAAPKKTDAAPVQAETAPAPAAEAKRAPNAAFMKALKPSAALAAVVGKEPLPRTEVTKKVWEYIKKHNLQDAANKRMINADAKLKKIFGKDQVSMFEMTKLISSQLS